MGVRNVRSANHARDVPGYARGMLLLGLVLLVVAVVLLAVAAAGWLAGWALYMGAGVVVVAVILLAADRSRRRVR